MTMRSQRGEMPGWLKVVLICAVVLVLGGIALFVFLFNMGNQFMKTALDPAGSAKTLHEIVTYQEPLPSGWNYVFNMSMPGMKMVSVANKGTSTFVSFIQTANPKHQSAEELLANPGTLRSSEARGFELQNRGEQQFAGQTMKYVQGRISNKGRESQMQMGVVALPSGNMVMVQTIEEGSDFDPEKAKPLFDRITGFPQ